MKSSKLSELERSSINEAILLNDLNILKKMIPIKSKCEIDIYGQTPIMIATANSRESLVLYLIEIGAQINKQDYAGNTPLMIACFHSNCKLVHILLSTRKVNVSIKNKNGENAISISTNHNQMQIIKELLNSYYWQRMRFLKLYKLGKLAGLNVNHGNLILAYI